MIVLDLTIWKLQEWKKKTENIKSYTDEKDANIQIYKDATYQAVCSLVTIPTHHFHEIYQHIYNHNIYVPTSLFYEKFEQRSDLWSRKIQSDPSLDARTGAILIVSKRKGMTRKTFFKGLKIGVTTKKFSRFDAAASFSVMNVWRRREESKSVWTEFPSACRLYFVSIADEWLKYVGFALYLPGFGANWSTDSQNEQKNHLKDSNQSVEMSSMFCSKRR